jgi:regulator of sigma E protease
VLRDGQELSFDLRSKEIGGEVDYLMGSGEGKKSFMIGVSQKTETQKVGFFESLPQAGLYVGYLSYINLKSIWGLFQGMISPDNLGGPISIIKEAAKSASNGLEKTFNFMIVLNIGLAVLNLLPIPILDGGHLLFFLIEAIRGKPLELRVQEYASRVGMFALLALMLYALSNDIRGLF